MPERTVAYRDGHVAGVEAVERGEDTADPDVDWWRGFLDALDERRIDR